MKMNDKLEWAVYVGGFILAWFLYWLIGLNNGNAFLINMWGKFR